MLTDHQRPGPEASLALPRRSARRPPRRRTAATSAGRRSRWHGCTESGTRALDAGGVDVRVGTRSPRSRRPGTRRGDDARGSAAFDAASSDAPGQPHRFRAPARRRGARRLPIVNVTWSSIAGSPTSRSSPRRLTGPVRVRSHDVGGGERGQCLGISISGADEYIGRRPEELVARSSGLAATAARGAAAELVDACRHGERSPPPSSGGPGTAAPDRDGPRCHARRRAGGRLVRHRLARRPWRARCERSWRRFGGDQQSPGPGTPPRSCTGRRRRAGMQRESAPVRDGRPPWRPRGWSSVTPALDAAVASVGVELTRPRLQRRRRRAPRRGGKRVRAALALLSAAACRGRGCGLARRGGRDRTRPQLLAHPRRRHRRRHRAASPRDRVGELRGRPGDRRRRRARRRLPPRSSSRSASTRAASSAVLDAGRCDRGDERRAGARPGVRGRRERRRSRSAW